MPGEVFLAAALIAGAILWAQRDRTINVAPTLHLGPRRSKDDLHEELQTTKQELAALRKDFEALTGAMKQKRGAED
ncbi:hypothetical protein WJX72_008887 [[Myrmecia] bisecta]|uniref:Uncharacterized protein n=1 Tax=[Myrmecia] bisecta TaxID=41462 RepID=A0AAW1PCY2_9CHLO